MEKIVESISKALKSLRKEKGWSLDVASQNTGVSKAMLGQIERGESSPTIATLWKIATGFDATFSSFIEEPLAPQSSHVHRDGVFQQLHPEDDKFLVNPVLPYDKTKGFEVYIIEISPGCEHLSPPHQEGVSEHIIVTQGCMEVLIDGKWQLLGEHDAVQFDAAKPHGYRNRSHARAMIHDIVHYR